MIPLVPLMTAFAVLLHALLGCCLHHAHAGATGAPAHPAATHHGGGCSGTVVLGEAAFGHATEHAGADQRLAICHPEHANEHDHDQPRQCQKSDCSVVLTIPAAFAVGVEAHWTHADDQAAAEATIRLAEVKRLTIWGADASPARRLSRLCIWLI